MVKTHKLLDVESGLEGIANQPGIISQDKDTVTLSRKEYDSLMRRAETDMLTNLTNRDGFDKKLRHDLDLTRRARQRTGGTNSDTESLTLVYFDINGLKYVNDTFGHEAGDQLLQTFSDLLKDYFPRTTDTKSRFGGDEFAAILPQTSLDWAVGKMEKFQAKAEEAGVFVSYGVSNYASSVGDPIIDGRYTKSAADVIQQLKKSADNDLILRKNAVYGSRDRNVVKKEFYHQRFLDLGFEEVNPLVIGIIAAQDYSKLPESNENVA